MLVDIIVIVFLVMFIVSGYKKGLALSLVNTCSFLFALVLTAIFYKQVVTWAAATRLGMLLTSNIQNGVNAMLSGNAELLVSELPLPEVLTRGIAGGAYLRDITDVLAVNVANAVITILTVIVLFIVIRILLALLKGPLQFVASLPVIKQVNQLAGAILGVFTGFFWLYVIVGAVGLFSFFPAVGAAAELISQSTFVSLLYNNNLLLYLTV